MAPSRKSIAFSINRSRHLVVSYGQDRLKLKEFQNFKDKKAEVQVRTILQHTWAAIDWKFRYKTDIGVPRDIRRRLYRISALLEYAEDDFTRVSQLVRELRTSYEQQIQKGNLAIEINQELLDAFLKKSETIDRLKSISDQAGYFIAPPHPRSRNPFLNLSLTLHTAAIFTDHEKLPDVVFVDEISKRTKRVILRGVELNVFVDAWAKPEGKVDKNLFFHLLVGFDPDGRQTSDYWLGDIYRNCEEQTRNSGGTKIKGVAASIDRICDVLREADAIVIAAHLHSTSNAFRSRSVDDIYSDPEFLRFAQNRFTALEVMKSETAAFFDGKHNETNFLRKACIRSS